MQPHYLRWLRALPKSVEKHLPFVAIQRSCAQKCGVFSCFVCFGFCLMVGVVDLINKDYFAEGSRILLVHTGGIQGIEGVNSILKRKNKILISK